MQIENKNLNRELVEKISKARDEPGWMLKNRLNAFDQFEKLAEPKFKYGLSIIMNLKDLDFSKFDFNRLEKPIDYGLPEDNTIEIMPFSQALQEKPEIIKKHCNQFEIKDMLDAMNAAFFNHGLFVHVPKNTELEKPLQINTLAKSLQISRIFVFVEDNSKLDFINRVNSEKVYGFRNEIVECFVGRNSKLNYADIQNLDEEIYNFSSKFGIAKNDSTLNWLSCCLGSRFTRDIVYTDLAGRGANTHNYGFFFGNKEQQFDLSAKTRHSAPNTVCDMATKGVVNEKAKAVYQGLVRIESNAPNSNGYQKEDVLILSDEAEADSIPQLEIGNNDVRCSHGASIGQIDKEKIFYLMTRGLTQKIATKKIVEGFFEPMIEKIHMQNLKEDVRKVIIERME